MPSPLTVWIEQPLFFLLPFQGPLHKNCSHSTDADKTTKVDKRHFSKFIYIDKKVISFKLRFSTEN